MREEDWELCKELARFLAALDDSGDTLREAMEMANVRTARTEGDDGALAIRLDIPHRNGNVARPESDPQSGSDAASVDSGTASPG